MLRRCAGPGANTGPAARRSASDIGPGGEPRQLVERPELDEGSVIDRQAVQRPTQVFSGRLGRPPHLASFSECAFESRIGVQHCGPRVHGRQQILVCLLQSPGDVGPETAALGGRSLGRQSSARPHDDGHCYAKAYKEHHRIKWLDALVVRQDLDRLICLHICRSGSGIVIRVEDAGKVGIGNHEQRDRDRKGNPPPTASLLSVWQSAFAFRCSQEHQDPKGKQTEAGHDRPADIAQAGEPEPVSIDRVGPGCKDNDADPRRNHRRANAALSIEPRHEASKVAHGQRYRARFPPAQQLVAVP